jgi:hypothetical protein
MAAADAIQSGGRPPHSESVLGRNRFAVNIRMSKRSDSEHSYETVDLRSVDIDVH